MPNPWTIIGWLVLVALVVAVFAAVAMRASSPVPFATVVRRREEPPPQPREDPPS